jgi:hypothetical protein
MENSIERIRFSFTNKLKKTFLEDLTKSITDLNQYNKIRTFLLKTFNEYEKEDRKYIFKINRRLMCTELISK